MPQETEKQAYLRLHLYVAVPLGAVPFAEALERAKKLAEKDVFAFKKGVDYLDGQIEVAGIVDTKPTY